jgi:hypothetical protein
VVAQQAAYRRPGFRLAWRTEPVFETARMYTGAQPAIPLPQVFAITTFELG